MKSENTFIPYESLTLKSRVNQLLGIMLYKHFTSLFQPHQLNLWRFVTSWRVRYPAEVQKQMAQGGTLVPGSNNLREDAEDVELGSTFNVRYNCSKPNRLGLMDSVYFLHQPVLWNTFLPAFLFKHLTQMSGSYPETGRETWAYLFVFTLFHKFTILRNGFCFFFAH